MSKDELFRLEQAAWAPLHDLLHGLNPEAADRPYTDLWTVKDGLAHIACWQAEAAQMLLQMREGTYEGWEDGHEEEINARFHEATRELPLDEVIASLHASRSRMLEELDRLPDDLLDDEARSWFVESGHEHYEEHLEGLRAVLG
ncbi:MAG TPA: maleylpyruvate isomerase N-terminal domain-containing protein [Actinomycetota bacterium]